MYTRVLSPLLALSCLIWIAAAQVVVTQTADRDRIRAFLQVTGFDVALDSIAFSAGGAPQMLGLPPGAFGSDWTRLTEEVFDKAVMRDMALQMLEATLETENLDHAVEFYASDLGQRLVEVENAAHAEPDDGEKQEEGRALVAALVEQGSERIALFKKMNQAIDGSESSLRAIQEIQFRFLLAASGAGVIDLRTDADGLRALLKEQEAQMRMMLQENALAGAAYTYQTVSDADLETYTEALENPVMQRVYELLNAVQYEIMANRFEVLAERMAELHPGQDI